MGTPMLRGLQPTDGDHDDGSLGSSEPQTSESRNVIAPVVIVLVAIVAVGAGFFYVTPKSAFSALSQEPEEPPAQTTIFEGLDRLRELGVIEGEDANPHEPAPPSIDAESAWTMQISAPPRRRQPAAPPRDPEFDQRMTRLQQQLEEAKRRMVSVGDARESSRSRTTSRSESRSSRQPARPVSRAQDESVRRSYGPLTRPGLFAFEGEERHATPRPVSYGALRRAGIATDYNKFLQAMTGSGLYRRNDRPPFYSIPTTDQERRQMSDLFDEFNELAPVWVQMGILRP